MITHACVPVRLTAIALWIGLVFCARPIAPAYGEGASSARRCVTCGKPLGRQYMLAGSRGFCNRECYRAWLPRCAECGAACEGTAILSNGRTFCSEACFNASLPTCEICGKRVRTMHIIDGHIYCAEDARSPRCSTCMLPCANGLTLRDGRLLCAACGARAVLTATQSSSAYRQARRETFRATGLMSDTLPVLTLVGLNRFPTNRMARTSDSNLLIESGVYRRTVTETSERNMFGMTLRAHTDVHEAIEILYGLSPERFLAVAVHELTHDILAERFPRTSRAPPWVIEGLCQYVAAAVCRRNGMSAMLHALATDRDRIYGDGYRYFTGRFGPDDWPAVMRWLSRVDPDGLPRDAPLGRTAAIPDSE